MVKKENKERRDGDSEEETFFDASSNMSEGSEEESDSEEISDLDEEDETFIKLPEELKNKVREFTQITKELGENKKTGRELNKETKELEEKKKVGKISKTEFLAEEGKIREKYKEYIKLYRRAEQLQKEFKVFEKKEETRKIAEEKKQKELEKLKPGVKPSDFKKKSEKSNLRKILSKQDKKTKPFTSEQLSKKKVQSLQNQVKFESQKSQNYLKQITKLTAELDNVNWDLKNEKEKTYNLVKVLKLLRENEEYN